MKEISTLIRIKHGSHLYGTNTAASDTDYKSVYLPAGKDIILQRAEKVIDKGTGSQDSKNTKDDIDDQAFTLMKFYQMLSVGDTVATEILFSPKQNIVEEHPYWETIIKPTGMKLLNKQCRGFVGYCQRQASKYGVKGSRVAACRDIKDVLWKAMDDLGTTTKLSIIEEDLENFVKSHEFSSIEEINNIPHLNVVDRKIPFTATIKVAYDVYAKIFENYGQRALLAEKNEGVDWKAVSHAVRVAHQAIELLEEGNITFPRPEASHLLDIKLGKLDYKIVQEELEKLVEKVEEVSLTSFLPEETDFEVLEKLVLELYNDQTK